MKTKALSEIFSLTHMTNGQNSKMKIYEAYLNKKIFEIRFKSISMAYIEQFYIIQDFTALWKMKTKS